MVQQLFLQIILLNSIFHTITALQYRLIFSHVIYRHGDRSPSSTFPKDPYQQEAWGVDWGQLTPKGVREQYELGSYLRQRYDSFLSKTFDRKEIYVRSSDRDRALESAESNLLGLFPAPGGLQCTNLLVRRPISIHAVPKQDDHLLQTDADNNCLTYQQVFQEQSGQYVKDINQKYDDFFKFLMNQTGLTKLSLENIGDVFSPISRERLYGWKLLAWVDQVWNETTGQTVYQIMAELRKRLRFLEYDSPEKARLMSGYLVGDILNRMKQKASGKLKVPGKMVMYSAHEGTLLGLLFGMNISNGLLVPYASCLIFELHQSISDPNRYFVSIHYRNDSTMDPFPLTTPGCSPALLDGVYCPLDDFETSINSTILYPIQNRNQACGLDACGKPIRAGASVHSAIVWCILPFVWMFNFWAGNSI